MVLLVACARTGAPALSQSEDAAATRALYEDLLDPLVSGQRHLLQALPAAMNHPIGFRLSASGASRDPGPVAGHDLWDEGRIVFFRIAAQDLPASPASLSPRQLGIGRDPLAAEPPWGPMALDGRRALPPVTLLPPWTGTGSGSIKGVARSGPPPAYGFYYFDPRSIQLRRVGPGTGGTGEIAIGADGVLSLFRAVPIAHKPSWTQADLDIVRFDFHVDPVLGTVRATGCQRLTSAPLDASLPVAVPEKHIVVYLERQKDGRQRLMQVGWHGAGNRPLIPGSTCSASYPRLLPDGSLLFAANPEGFWRIYRYDFTSGKWGSCTNPPPAPRMAGGFILGCRFASDGATPAIVRLPRSYDLPTLLALVDAHNPAVNKSRALLAAALIEARQLTLANLPTLTFGLDYTPVAGLLSNAASVTGDHLAAGLGEGLLGIVQSLLDIDRNVALSEAGRMRAEIAHDALLDERNNQEGEAAELYFTACGLMESETITHALVDNARRRKAYIASLRREGQALGADLLTADKDLAKAENQASLIRHQLGYQIDRLKELCGLPTACEMVLDRRSYRFDLEQDPSFSELRRLALLNHPRLRAARRALDSAFFQMEATDRYQPEAYFSTTYGNTRREFIDPVDDYITMSLSGTLPLAAIPNKALQAEHDRQIMRSIRLDAEEQSRAIAAALDKDLVRHEEALGLVTVDRDQVAEALEQVRLARLHLVIGPADADHPVTPIDLIQAHQAYYQALLAVTNARTQTAITHSLIWRDLGLSNRLAQQSLPLRDDRVAQERTSVWIWKSKDLIGNQAAVDRFLVHARQYRFKRAYVYLYSDARLLADPASAENLARFIDRCADNDIEVWGLMGEPEWLQKLDGVALGTGIARMRTFNTRFGQLQPRLAGLKLDLEPGSQPGWNSDPGIHSELDRRYLALLRLARRDLPTDLPLWVDCPVSFFRDAQQPLLEALVPVVDGMTLMCYNDRSDWIVDHSVDALAHWPKAMEIGLEVSRGAPAGETLAQWSADEITALRRTLVQRCRDDRRFQGVALHDYSGLTGRPMVGTGP